MHSKISQISISNFTGAIFVAILSVIFLFSFVSVASAQDYGGDSWGSADFTNYSYGGNDYTNYAPTYSSTDYTNYTPTYTSTDYTNYNANYGSTDYTNYATTPTYEVSYGNSYSPSYYSGGYSGNYGPYYGNAYSGGSGGYYGNSQNYTSNNTYPTYGNSYSGGSNFTSTPSNNTIYTYPTYSNGYNYGTQYSNQYQQPIYSGTSGTNLYVSGQQYVQPQASPLAASVFLSQVPYTGLTDYGFGPIQISIVLGLLALTGILSWGMWKYFVVAI